MIFDVIYHPAGNNSYLCITSFLKSVQLTSPVTFIHWHLTSGCNQTFIYRDEDDDAHYVLQSHQSYKDCKRPVYLYQWFPHENTLLYVCVWVCGSLWRPRACKCTDDALVCRICFLKRAPDKSRSRGEESPLSVRYRSIEACAVNPVTQREIQLPWFLWAIFTLTSRDSPAASAFCGAARQWSSAWHFLQATHNPSFFANMAILVRYSSPRQKPLQRLYGFLEVTFLPRCAGTAQFFSCFAKHNFMF